jgi:mediator of RNA polymerase II transcription subunit 11
MHQDCRLSAFERNNTWSPVRETADRPLVPSITVITMNREVRMDPLSSKDRLAKLESIEKELANAMASAGQAMTELAKDKPVLKSVENNTSAFLKSLTQVEADLSKQIQYLTQVSSGQAHEGSSYASQKVLTMAWHRIEHTKTRLLDLDRMNSPYMQQQQVQPPAAPAAQPHQQMQHPLQQQAPHAQSHGTSQGQRQS